MSPQLFREELNQIQQRHSVAFPIEQLRFITTEDPDGEHKLVFLNGYNLASVITLEIELAFKLVFSKP